MSKNQKISDLEARLNQLERRFKEHKHSRGIIDELRGYRDPDPPLNARVEKVLGEEIQYFWDYGWLVKDIDRRGPSDLIRGEFWRKPYKRDTDRDLAIGALEKYREMHYPDAFPIMILENRYRSYSGGEWTVVIGAKNKQQIIDGIYGDDLEAVDFSIAVNRDGLPVVAADSLPEAVCRAIVKHAEGR